VHEGGSKAGGLPHELQRVAGVQRDPGVITLRQADCPAVEHIHCRNHSHRVTMLTR
jgi:hypothetical protein